MEYNHHSLGEQLHYWLTFAWIRPDARYVRCCVGEIVGPEGETEYIFSLRRLPFPEEKKLKENVKAWREAQQFPLNHPVHGHMARHALLMKWYRNGRITKPNCSGKYERIIRTCEGQAVLKSNDSRSAS